MIDYVLWFNFLFETCMLKGFVKLLPKIAYEKDFKKYSGITEVLK